MLKRLKVSHGIFTALLILTLVQLISSAWNVYGYMNNAQQIAKIANNYLRVNALDDAYSTIAVIRSQTWKIAFLMANGVTSEDDKSQLEKLRQDYTIADESMKHFLALSAKGTSTDQQHAQNIYQLYQSVKQLQLNNLQLLENHEFKSLAHSSNKSNPTQDLLMAIKQTNNVISEKVILPAIEKSNAAVHDAILLSVIFIAICIVFMLFALFWSKRYVVNKINQLMVYQSAIARGDLSVPIHIDGNNEIDHLTKGLADMQDSLSETIHAVAAGSGNIYTSVQEIAAGNNDLSSRTEEQASALEQTAASMEQLTSTVKNNAENARQVANMASFSEQTAKEGGELTRKMVETMGLITQSSNKISEIIGVIDGIAFQTNILALNAAVEAARAGTHGQGFAVVAAEVRSLALRSAEAAKEIKSLIDTSSTHVQAGNTLTGQVDQTIRQMMDSAAGAAVTLDEIFRATEEQSRGIEQISVAVNQMDSVTQQNAALVEQSATATASLEEQVKRLNHLVSFFKVDNLNRNNGYAGSQQANGSLRQSLGYQGE